MIAAWLEGARRAWRRRRAQRLFAASGLFDADWYRRAYPDSAGRDPVDDFLDRGAAQGRRPHPLFDTAWYLARHADVAETGINPLVHYIMAGAAEGRDPNPYFFSRWYVANNRDAGQAMTPLTHYARIGGPALRDPSPKFDARWYADMHPDVAASGLDPLSHFLTIGRAQGCAPTELGDEVFRGEPVDAARLTPFLPLESALGQTVALMVAHCPDGVVKPNVVPYVRALASAGVKVVLIAAADAPFTPDPLLTPYLAGGFVRENRGYDFAAWAHVLRAEPGLYAARTLLLLNDSIIGPTRQADLEALLARIEASPADVVGATDSREQAWHLQSFFLALKGRVLASYALHQVFDRVRSLSDKDHVIKAYELTLTERLQSAGFVCEPLFPSAGDVNPTIFDWRGLLERGFPFVKTLTLRGAFAEADIAGWRETLAATGFDPAIAEAAIAAPVAPSAPPPEGWPLLRPPARPPSPQPPLKVAFIGPWNFASGLGGASRGYMSALWRTGLRLNLHPVERPFALHGRVTPTVCLTEFEGPADAVIVHLNPDAWSLMTEDQKRIVERARTRIGLFVWEMEQVPPEWTPVLKTLDAVWAPSRYCAEAFGQATGLPVSVVPHVIPVPPRPEGQGRALTLKRLGLADDVRLILYAFDGSSYLVRKNPQMLLKAFAAAGLARDGWRLVLKTKHLAEGGPQGAALKAQAQATPGVWLLDQALPPATMTALFEAADLYASPHRSEGFGLTIAEAMALGKTVVASDYGGARDFLDESCGLPVPTRRTVMARGEGHYVTGAAWGEPDETAFAAALRAAAARIEAGDHRLGEAARARIAERLSPQAVADVIGRALTSAVAASGGRAP